MTARGSRSEKDPGGDRSTKGKERSNRNQVDVAPERSETEWSELSEEERRRGERRPHERHCLRRHDHATLHQLDNAHESQYQNNVYLELSRIGAFVAARMVDAITNYLKL